ILNEPEAVCAQTGLPPFCAINKPPAGDDPFRSKKPPQEKPEKPERPTRPKTRVVKRPANKKKTTASSDPPADDDVGNPDLEDDAEVSHADAVEVIALSFDSQQHEARRTTPHSSQGTSHSSSGESSATQLPPLKTVLGAKPRPSKKARLDKAAEENVAPEPEKIPDPEATIRDDVPNDPPPQDHDFITEE
uniref:Uncharacterized protein n=1 Tax=Triticum urartu TaxID=4572 RepID=A0A8R7QVA4_TRIUA